MKRENLSIKSVVSQIEDIVASDIDGEKVMMSMKRGRYYSLDPVGSRVWEMIERPIKVSDLIDMLMLKYDVDRETCECDTLTFLEELLESGILQIRD
jgi:hypothetical protein